MNRAETEPFRNRYMRAHAVPPHALIRSVVSDASALTGLPPAVLRGPSRLRSIAYVRFAVMKVAYDLGLSTPQIGRVLGRDHTSILYGIRRACELIEADPDFAEMVRELSA